MIIVCDLPVQDGAFVLPNFREIYKIEFDKPVTSFTVTTAKNFQVVNVTNRRVIYFSPEAINTHLGNFMARYEPKSERRVVTLHMRSTYSEQP